MGTCLRSSIPGVAPVSPEVLSAWQRPEMARYGQMDFLENVPSSVLAPSSKARSH